MYFEDRLKQCPKLKVKNIIPVYSSLSNYVVVKFYNPGQTNINYTLSYIVTNITY